MVQFPQVIESLVERMEFVPPPSAATGVNMTMISAGETTTITFGSTRIDHDVEQQVAEALHHWGAQGLARTNWRRNAGER